MSKEYYKHTCACGCGGRILKRKEHAFPSKGIPVRLRGHNKGLYIPKILIGRENPNYKHGFSGTTKYKRDWRKRRLIENRTNCIICGDVLPVFHRTNKRCHKCYSASLKRFKDIEYTTSELRCAHHILRRWGLSPTNVNDEITKTLIICIQKQRIIKYERSKLQNN